MITPGLCIIAFVEFAEFSQFIGLHVGSMWGTTVMHKLARVVQILQNAQSLNFRPESPPLKSKKLNPNVSTLCALCVRKVMDYNFVEQGRLGGYKNGAGSQAMVL